MLLAANVVEFYRDSMTVTILTGFQNHVDITQLIRNFATKHTKINCVKIWSKLWPDFVYKNSRSNRIVELVEKIIMIC